MVTYHSIYSKSVKLGPSVSKNPWPLKSDSIQSKVLRLPRFFPRREGNRKKRQFQNTKLASSSPVSNLHNGANYIYEYINARIPLKYPIGCCLWSYLQSRMFRSTSDSVSAFWFLFPVYVFCLEVVSLEHRDHWDH